MWWHRGATAGGRQVSTEQHGSLTALREVVRRRAVESASGVSPILAVIASRCDQIQGLAVDELADRFGL